MRVLPMVDVRRVYELMAIEKIRPITQDELDSCVFKADTSPESESAFQEMVNRMSPELFDETR